MQYYVVHNFTLVKFMMSNKVTNLLKKFSNEKAGNIALMSGLLLLPVLLAAGSAFDYARYLNAMSKASVAADSAVLAGMREVVDSNDLDIAKQVANNFYDVNFQGSEKLFNIQRTIDITRNMDDGSVLIESTLAAQLPTTFMRIANIDTLNVNVIANAKIQLPKVEISMVLDVSQSMQRSNRIGKLKDAATEFVNIINPIESDASYRVISIIPYANSVNFGSSYTDLLGAGNANFPNSDFVGCYDPESDALLRSNVINPVITDGDPDTGLFAYKNTSLKNGNPFCPPNNSNTTMFTGNKTALLNKINDLQLGFGTATDVALSWGWRALSPQWRGRFAGASSFPADFDDSNHKFIVLLTDGAILRQKWEVDANGKKSLVNYSDEAADNFNALCNDIRNQGDIRVFTIGYDTASLGTDLRDSLRDCATNSGDFFEVSTNELRATFDKIANSISTPLLTN